MSSVSVYCLLSILCMPVFTSAAIEITTDHVEPIEVRLGDNVALRAQATGLPSNMSRHLAGWLFKSTYKYVEVFGPDAVGDSDVYEGRFDEVGGRATLTIKQITREQNGTVSFQIQTASRVFKSPDISIVVLVPPTLVVMKVNGDLNKAVEGVPCNVSCVAAGSNPGVDMQWMHNGEPVTTGVTTTREKGNDGTTYTTTSYVTVTATKDNHGDEYKCVVSGKQMPTTIEKSQSLNVEYAPKVTMSVSPAQTFQLAEEKVTFSCEAQASPAVDSWKWFLEEEELSETSSVLVYNSISSDLNGKTVKCLATNSIGSGEQGKTLDVYYPPTFTKTPENVEADIGVNVTLLCQAEGNPPPTISWSKVVGKSSPIIVSKEVLVIPRLQEDDFGQYKCSAAVGRHFDTLTHDFYILKKGVPQVTNADLGPYSYSQGEDGIISCKADSVPLPTTIIWSKGKDNTVIDLAGSSRHSMHREDRLGGVTITLSIRDLASTDFDTYNCTIANTRGSDSAIYTLQQINNFPWMWVLIVAGAVVLVVIIITVSVCVCKRNKTKTSSAGSLSVMSNTTDNSTKKPSVGMENAEMYNLPEYGMTPIDRWRNDEEPNGSDMFDMVDTSRGLKPELYRTQTPNSYNNFSPRSAYPPGNYGSYRVQHPSLDVSPAPPYSTLPIRPANMHPEAFSRSPYTTGFEEEFPEPPPPQQLAEQRLATNV